MPRGTRLSTEEKAQIRALSDAGLSSRAIGRQIGRTHCLVSTYLRNPDGYSKKKDTGRRRTLTAHDERQICRQASNSCSSLNQIRAQLRLPVSKTTIWRALHRNENITIDDLKTAVIEAWEDVEDDTLKNLVNSMPNRLFEVASRQGGPIDY
ncbi:hypothetical protein ANCCEY_02195 [Ancylostoma ceylanicum]|uniref:Uncharacterized protein n=1 Tax=Ancylostoma ceylanicum TaxID=53326 RepID=A0A0D6M899_9BILA|nr:hypothetical protein ANCCEY_02195 [Ancylostoma ceylanicum]